MISIGNEYFVSPPTYLADYFQQYLFYIIDFQHLQYLLFKLFGWFGSGQKVKVRKLLEG